MSFLQSPEDLDAFVAAWRDGRLLKAEWTHAAHVGVTGYYAVDRTPDELFETMKAGIRHFNKVMGTIDGPDSGYHETLTRFWCNAIASAVSAASPVSRFDAARIAVERFGNDRELPFRYYSFNLVRDRRSRREWVAPDREPA